MKYHNHVLNNKCRPRDSLLLLNRIGKKNKKNEKNQNPKSNQNQNPNPNQKYKKKLVKQSKIMCPKLFYSSTVKKKKLHINYNMLLVDTLLLEGTSIPVVKSQKKFLIVYYVVNVYLVILYYYLFVLI